MSSDDLSSSLYNKPLHLGFSKPDNTFVLFSNQQWQYCKVYFIIIIIMGLAFMERDTIPGRTGYADGNVNESALVSINLELSLTDNIGLFGFTLYIIT